MRKVFFIILVTVVAVGSQITPIRDQILVRPITLGAGSKVKIPTDTKIPTQVGKVVKVGPGKWENSGRTPMEVDTGNYVLYPAFRGTPLLINDTAYTLITSSDVMALYVID